MKTAELSTYALTLGLTLSACTQPIIEAGDGEGESDTESGDGDGDAGDGDGDDTGDGDGDDMGDGDGDDMGDGDGDGEPAECGNGMVEGDEACDDGNQVDDDACTNACTAPACGDGIVQASNEEDCDDGNQDPGDTCTVSCKLPGALIWEVLVDVDGGGSEDVGAEVEIDSQGNIDVLVQADGAYELHEFDGDGNHAWTSIIPFDIVRTNLALGPNDELAVGGHTNGNQGTTRVYNSSGTFQWSENVAAPNSEIRDLDIDGEGNVVVAGFHANNDALLESYDSAGAVNWSHKEDEGVALGPVYVADEGQIWTIRAMPRRAETYTSEGDSGWTSAMIEDASYADLVADDEGNLYVLSAAKDGTLLSLTKFDNSGDQLWSVDHDDELVLESAGGVALLPGGNGVVIAGSTNGEVGESDGLLAWYDANGDPLLGDLVVDGEADTDRDIFYDIEISGSYAVVVGTYDPDDADADLWIRKFEI